MGKSKFLLSVNSTSGGTHLPSSVQGAISSFKLLLLFMLFKNGSSSGHLHTCFSRGCSTKKEQLHNMVVLQVCFDFEHIHVSLATPVAAAGSSLFFTHFLFLLAPVFFTELCIVKSRFGLCPVRCHITGGHCAREVCEVRGIKMLTLKNFKTTCVRSILDIFYNFQTKI